MKIRRIHPCSRLNLGHPAASHDALRRLRLRERNSFRALEKQMQWRLSVVTAVIVDVSETQHARETVGSGTAELAVVRETEQVRVSQAFRQIW